MCGGEGHDLYPTSPKSTTGQYYPLSLDLYISVYMALLIINMKDVSYNLGPSGRSKETLY